MNAIAQSSTSPASGPQLDNRRVLAGLIDLAIVVAGTVAIGVIAGIYDGDAPAVSLPVAAVMTAWALYYYFACESGGGQTLGKKVMRLRVVRVDGRPAGMGDIAVRTVVRVLDMQFVYLVGLITMLATGKRRGRLGDLAAGTMVVAADGPAPVTPAAAAVAAGPETLSRPEAMGAAAPAPVAPAPPEIRPFDPPAEPATNAPSEPVYPEEPARDLAAPSEPPPAVAEEAVAEPAVEAPEEAAVEPWAEAVVEPASPVEPAEEAAAPVDEPVLEAVVEPAFPLQDDPAEEAASPVHEPVLEAVVEPAFEVEEEELHEETAPEPLAAVDDLSLAGGPVLPMDDLSELDPYADEGELADLDALEDEPVVAPAFPVEDVLEPEPVVELHPVSVPLPAPEVEVPEAAQPDPDDGDDDEPEVVVKSVETVSAIDLVMGDDEPVRDEPEADPSAESDQQ